MAQLLKMAQVLAPLGVKKFFMAIFTSTSLFSVATQAYPGVGRSFLRVVLKKMSSGGLPFTQETGEGDHLSEANLETEASGGGSGDAASGAGAGAGAGTGTGAGAGAGDAALGAGAMAVVEGGQVVSDCCKWSTP